MTIRRLHIILFAVIFYSVFSPTKICESKISFQLVSPCQNTILKKVALTFDDGPHPGYTQAIIEILKKFDIKATFFLVGKQVEKYPWLVKYIIENSRSKIANHTYSHKNLTLLNTKQILEELLKTQDILCKEVGSSDRLIPYFRPPGGHFNSRVVSTAEKIGLKMVLWSVFTNDHNPAVTKEKLLKTVQDLVNSEKEIILLHSGSRVTLEVLPEIIKFLKENGYEFVTVDEILNDETYYVN